GSNDTIVFDLPTGQRTITLTSNDANGAFGPTALVITAAMTIDGTSDGVTLSGNNAQRLFAVVSTATLTLQGLTLSNGLASGSGVSAQGGAIYSQGDLTLNRVTVQNNTAQGANGGPGGSGSDAFGGGVYVAAGTATLTDDTLSGNRAMGGGGGGGGGGDFQGFSGGSGGAAFGRRGVGGRAPGPPTHHPLSPHTPPGRRRRRRRPPPPRPR